MPMLIAATDLPIFDDASPSQATVYAATELTGNNMR